ncbi:MAG TPA: helix-turn-helix transcriptional regulator [Catenuloplanes sp.]|jgi:transcriptional regulator with XRE-family HTH domain
MAADATIGDRVAEVRTRRALTQEELAERAGVSVATIRKLERNERTSVRMVTLHRLATAMAVTTSDLLRPAPSLSGPPSEPDHAAVRELRRALTPPRSVTGVLLADEDTEAPTLEGLRQSLHVANGLYVGSEYSASVKGVSTLAAELRIAAQVLPEPAHGELLRLTSQYYDLTALLLTQLRLFDLAYLALERAVESAERAGDTLLVAQSVTTQAFLLLRQGRLDEAAQVAQVTAEVIEPRFSTSNPREIAMWGHLHLWASAALARDSQHEAADEALSLAEAAASRVARHERGLGMPFGPNRVAIQAVENEVVQGRPDRALVLAERIRTDDEDTVRRLCRYLLNVASAQTDLRQYAEATETLVRIRTVVPEWLRYQRFAAATVSRLIRARKRALPPELRDLADFFAVQA